MPVSGTETGWERLFWLVFRQSSNAIAVIDDQRRFVDVNDAALALLGRPHEEVIGSSIADSILASEQAASEREWQEFLRTGEYSGARDLIGPDGSIVTLDFAAQLAVIGGRRLAIYVALTRSRLPIPLAASGRGQTLTKREREVVTLIALGQETSEIAKELHISAETVRTHVRNAMSKLGARTRAQLVAQAICADQTLHPLHLEA